MRIGIDARLWNESGVGRYIRNLVSELKKLNKKNEYVLFVLSKDEREILHFVQNDNFKVIKADIRWHTIQEQLRFPSVLNKEKLDLVHFPYFSVPILYKRPFVVTIHDLILHHFPTGEASTLPFPLYRFKLLGYKFIIGQAAKNAAKVIAVSNATKQEIVDHLEVDSEKVAVTYEGADKKISKIKNEISKMHISKAWRFALKNKNYFLYVGNAYPHKNLERLFEAFRSLCHPELVSGSRASDIRLVLVGKEDYFYKRLKEKVAKMELQNSVIFYGEANDEDLAYLYQNALALVMPSLMEGFGLPAVEAMANKCLVLGSDIPSLKEICQDAAIYFNPYAVEDIANAMRAVYSNDTYHYSDNLKKGFTRARMFSWEEMAKETLKVYKQSLITHKQSLTT